MRGITPLSLLLGAAVLTSCGTEEVSSPDSNSPGMQPVQDGPLPVLRTARLVNKGFPGLPEAAQKFQITLRFINPPTDEQREQFETGASRWQGLIFGDVEETEGTIPANGCGPSIPLPEFTGVIDDIMINVLLQEIDGPGGILGQAGACFVRLSDGLPLYGVMFFDTEDLEFLETNSLLDEVIVHEMGHVLGFSGGIFNLNIPGEFSRNLLANPNTPDPRFLGRLARAMYLSLGGRQFGGVPVEGTPCGPGTRNSHWDENTFFNELMTGFLNGASANFVNPLSRMTSAAMRDLGYRAVPLGERYDLQPSPLPDPCVPAPAPSAATAAADRGGLDIANREVILEPVGVVQ
jgi:Leishmanolysin